MIIVVFELTILFISFFFYEHIWKLLSGGNIALSLLLGVVIGIVDFSLTCLFVKKSERAKNFFLEYHESYRNSSKLDRFVFKPLLISVPEELFFRGVVNIFVGWFWSSILFALLHVLNFKDKALTFISIFLYGFTFFIPLWLSGSLIGSIVAHYIFTVSRIAYFSKKI